MLEKPYEFRKFLDQFHLPDRYNPESAPAAANEVQIDESWTISIKKDASRGVVKAAQDLQDYFLTSMQLAVPVKRYEAGKAKQIILLSESSQDTLGAGGKEKRSYTYICEADEIKINGKAWQGTAQGVYYLEDLMNMREAPVLEQTETPVKREPFFSPRMVHSGWGLDRFPDTQLVAIAHNGFDAIILLLTDTDKTTYGMIDCNALIRRAGEFGLDVYLYGYLDFIDSYKHPDDEDADEFFDKNYGSIFKNCPDAKGIILVSESCEFPTRDPNAQSKKASYLQGDGFASVKASSGWWPCSDYPQWVDAVKRAVWKYNPKADVIFWTYGFGNAPSEHVRNMVLKMSTDISLLATFEMYEQIEYPNHTALQPDYSITFPGPCRSFKVQAEAAKEINLPLYSMTNTAGRTWDGGFVPYIPVPQQWFRRYEGMHNARKNWGLSGVMDSHHFGWYPSVIVECSKWSFWSPQPDMNQVLNKIATRIFGDKGAVPAVEAWRLFSEAIDSYTPSFDDQNGALRVGAAYPLVFNPYLYPHIEQYMKYPRTKHCFAGSIVDTLYKPEQKHGGTASGRRFHEDIKIIKKLLDTWETGNKKMNEALVDTPQNKLEAARKVAAVSEFYFCGLVTMWHVKRWWVLNKKLEIESEFEVAHKIMDELEDIVKAEMKNVKRAIPLAEENSILGWEPRMDYAGGAWHLKWKMRQLENLLKYTLYAYRQTLQKKPPLLINFPE